MTFAMAREGNFFASIGKVHPTYQTPGNALWLHFIIMTIMVLSGSFYILTDMYIFVLWLFNLMLISGIFILRKKMPAAERPYKIFGYPWIPALLLLFNLLYLVITLYSDISNYMAGKSRMMNSIFGIVLTGIGIPFYWYFQWKYKKGDLVREGTNELEINN
jgi:APA family basic amino acid/polyamine antiporter